jgi:hypothetical protein
VTFRSLTVTLTAPMVTSGPPGAPSGSGADQGVVRLSVAGSVDNVMVGRRWGG